MTEPEASPPASARSPLHGAALVLALALLAVVVIRTAWLCDDAYITFRSVDNWQSGHGLGWNPGERVQAYTHPLWMLLVSLVTWATGELYHTVLATGLVLTLVAAGLAARAAGGGLAAVTAVFVLVSSRAFVDYSTSGLEDPLSHALLGAFLVLWFRERDAHAPPPLGLLLVAGLAVATRMDTLVLYLPALALLFFRGLERGRALRRIGRFALGFAPFLAWELFSVVYYGFPFPNSAYAKLGTGIGAGELFAQGLAYLDNSLDHDPLTLVAIALALVLCAIRRVPRALPVALGVVLYLLYVTRVGGDFMSGRMLSLPLFGAVVLLGRAVATLPPRTQLVAPLAALALGFAAPFPNLLSGADFGPTERIAETGDRRGIVDERRFYYRATGLFSPRRESDMPAHAWAVRGIEAKRARERVVTRHTIGYFGYHAGPRVYVVDLNALSDPLLARIPRLAPPRPKDRLPWRIGHFTRELPDGYLETLETGRNAIEHEALARFYDELNLVVAGPLFDPRRWDAILALNTGGREPWMRAYLDSLE